MTGILKQGRIRSTSTHLLLQPYLQDVRMLFTVTDFLGIDYVDLLDGLEGLEGVEETWS